MYVHGGNLSAFLHSIEWLEMNFVRLSYDRVTYNVDRDVSSAILLVFITSARWYAAIGAFRSYPILLLGET